MTTEKQICRVLDAYREGCRTTREVEEKTGLPARHCSSLTAELQRCGLVVKVGTAERVGRRGKLPGFYEPTERAR